MARHQTSASCTPRLRATWATLLSVALLPIATSADEWPQWRGPQRDGVWRETGLVTEFATEQLPLKWSVEIGSGYSGPTVADGRVYVTDRVLEPEQLERVHCFAFEDGKKLWTHQYPCAYEVGYPAGPRAAVTIDDGRAYALGTMGHLHCYDAATGELQWAKDLNSQYQIRMPIWGIAASPIVVGDLLIAQIGGSQGACLVAFDKTSGDERWRALTDDASYAAPVLVEQAGKTVMVCLTGDNVVGMNPADGEVYWKHPFPPSRMVISIATPITDGNRLFITSFYDGALMLRLNPNQLEVEEVWRRKGFDERHTDALHSIISTPYLEGDYIYGVDSYGELRCLDAETGDRIWETLDAVPYGRWSTIHMVRNAERVWMLNERGELIISRMTPAGYEEIDRAKLLEPTTEQLRQRGGVVWAHPAFAYQHIFARNDNELVCASLAAE